MGITFEHLPVLINPRKNGSRHRKMNAGRIEPSPRQDMVHQIAMDAPVPVRKRMNVDEAK